MNAPTATQTRDLLLRRSFVDSGQLLLFLARAGLLIVWLRLNVSGFRSILPPGWHEDAFACKTRPGRRLLSPTWGCVTGASVAIGLRRVPLWSTLVVKPDARRRLPSDP
jgi:hypothetical protein